MAQLPDKAQALHGFWSSFGLTAYDETTVPTGENSPLFPYITYNTVINFIGNDTTLYGSLWYRSQSWDSITQKAQEIADHIGDGGRFIPFNGGAMWVRRGIPFAQRMSEPEDDTIRRIYINITVEYISAN